MEDPTWNENAVEFIDSNIIDIIKTIIRYCNKKRPDETPSQVIYVKDIHIAMSQPSVKELLTWKIKIKS